MSSLDLNDTRECIGSCSHPRPHSLAPRPGYIQYIDFRSNTSHYYKSTGYDEFTIEELNDSRPGVGQRDEGEGEGESESGGDQDKDEEDDGDGDGDRSSSSSDEENEENEDRSRYYIPPFRSVGVIFSAPLREPVEVAWPSPGLSSVRPAGLHSAWRCTVLVRRYRQGTQSVGGVWEGEGCYW